MSQGFRDLTEGEKVEFTLEASETKGCMAGNVSGPGGATVKSLPRGARKNKGARRYTKKCYNCDEFGHKVNECEKPRKTERVCHNCGSQDHLIRRCPVLLKLLANLKGTNSELIRL